MTIMAPGIKAMVDSKDPDSSGSEDETIKSPHCPGCEGETDLIEAPDGHALYLCPVCDAMVRNKILEEMSQQKKK